MATAQKADGRNTGALGLFADVVGSISGILTIAQSFGFEGLSGQGAERMRDYCNTSAASCRRQDSAAGQGGSSVKESSETLSELLHSCETTAEEMIGAAEEVLAQCESLAQDTNLASIAKEVASHTMGQLVEGLSALFEARNSCIEQCLNQAAHDLETAVVATPPQPPTAPLVCPPGVMEERATAARCEPAAAVAGSGSGSAATSMPAPQRLGCHCRQRQFQSHPKRLSQ